jgi:hypothetical protein
MNNNMQIEDNNAITVGFLVSELSKFNNDMKIVIGPDRDGRPIKFYRLKKRDELLLQIEISPEAEANWE